MKRLREELTLLDQEIADCVNAIRPVAVSRGLPAVPPHDDEPTELCEVALELTRMTDQVRVMRNVLTSVAVEV